MDHQTPHRQPPQTFADICVLLRLNQLDPVRTLLEQAPWPLRERSYLLAGIHCAEDAWAKAEPVLLTTQENGAEVYRAQTQGYTWQRKRPWLLWLLGHLAEALGQEEAAGDHYHRALLFLNQRRFNIPWLRIQLLGDSARCRALLDPAGAQARYEQALALCTGEQQEHPAAPALLLGLTLTSQQPGQILFWGKRALTRLTDEQAQVRILTHMALAYDQLDQAAQAIAAYEAALARARDHITRLSLWMALARLHLRHADLAAAQVACERAWDARSFADPATRSRLFLLCGRVALAQAHTGNVEQRRMHMHDSLTWVLQAVRVAPQTEEAFPFLANVLEELLQHDALVAATPLWQDGYTTLTRHLFAR